MIALKQVIPHPDTNSVEATWVDTIDGQEVVVKCHSYSDVQMDMLRADLGADAPQYEELMATVEAGIVPPPPKTPEQIAQECVEGVQSRLDEFARTRNYSGILSLCTYATDSNPKFAAEGQYGVETRSQHWATLYEILAEVQAGTRPVPSGYAEIESELPVLEWPVL